MFPLSTLDTAGSDAAEIARLFWWMAAAAVLIWAAMVALALYSARGEASPHARRLAPLLIIGGGVVLPTILLAVLLVFGLPPLSRLADAPKPGSLLIDVSGEQWWWRVRYVTPSGEPIELANEIRLPVGERIDVRLTSDNVIHSFWIPSISGKVDMIPGRTTHLSLEPTRTGIFRGTCAEYCGTAHALMAFPVVVLEKDAFDAWLVEQSHPARDPTTDSGARGRDLFLFNGCAACHQIRGTPASGTIGPDLTHVASRGGLAAGSLPTDAMHFADWIAKPDEIKPGVHMPAFGMLAPEDLQAISVYLSELR